MARDCCECLDEASQYLVDNDGNEVPYCDKHADHANGKLCDDTECQDCCDHYDHDLNTCLQCGKNLTESLIVAAYDKAKSLRKYG